MSKNMRYTVLGLQIFLTVFGALRECVAKSDSGSNKEEDLLVPYRMSHDDNKRSLRHVRECQHIIHGNHTYESYKSDNSTDKNFLRYFKYLSHNFEYRNGPFDTKRKLIHGHIAVVRNPIKNLAVLYPKDALTCSKWSGVRQTVSDTARHGKCTLAINAGFFNTHTAGCLGNIISNGKIVHDSNGVQNANFGIRKDGSIVTGYLSEDDVADSANPFVQLVSGVGWLIRNGKIYINESKKAECADTEETGTIERFFDVVSARSAIGHDKDGQIILITVDGKTDKDGVNLLELAQLLKEHGAVNAINLDGGGSATFVVNGTVVNYPSDTCDKEYSCERKVSTVICIHDQACEDCECSNGEDLVNGVRKCKKSLGGKITNVTISNGRTSKTEYAKHQESTLTSKREEMDNSKSMDRSVGGVWFLSLTIILGCSLLMNIFLVVVLRVTKKKQEKPWRQGDLRGLLDDDSDGI